MDAASLTRTEAEERAGLLAVVRYDLEVDLRGLYEGEVLEAVSTILFTCHAPGTATFVDCAAEVRRATLNGVDIDLDTVADGRIPLPDLAADNLLVVESNQAETGSGAGVRRSVDSSDKLVYVWTSFEPDEARRVWACFDQPDLKAPHAFTVHAHESWTVTSNCGPGSVADHPEGGRTWTFPDTPPLSTYVVVVNAGPFHEIRSVRGGHDLGLYCRQSLKENFERDAEDLFRVTEQGLAFFGERFGAPFPQRRYDQVFVPDMGGAMENWGCVTWGDSMLTRRPPTYSERSVISNVLLHEMAHMWFGDLVTMRWWDDLWLNEAFASWAADWALAGATEFTDSWASFLAEDKLVGYREDMGPATHPIRSEVVDVAHATANFDGITYLKGQSVLRQLAAYVGEDAFLRGLQAYFSDFAWGNTRLDDLMLKMGEAAGRYLSRWTVDWLDRAGTDTLTLAGGVLTGEAPDGESPRQHRLGVGCYARAGGRLEPLASVPVELSDAAVAVELPEADLVLPNDGDLTFAAVRTDAASTRVLVEEAAGLPDPMSRALAVTTCWDMMVKDELSSGDLVDCVLGVLAAEESPALVEPFLAMAGRAVERWSPPSELSARQARLAEVATSLAGHRGHRQAALRTVARCAAEAAHFAVLDEAAADDVDLAWRVLARRAELGEYDDAAVEALLDRDPDPEAAIRALGVRAALADEAAKAEVWEALFVARSVPAGQPTSDLAGLFWRPGQPDLLLPWAHRYLDEVERLDSGGMLSVMSLVGGTFPPVGDQEFVDQARALAEAPDTLPFARSTLLTGTDTLVRMLRARRAPR